MGIKLEVVQLGMHVNHILRMIRLATQSSIVAELPGGE